MVYLSSHTHATVDSDSSDSSKVAAARLGKSHSAALRLNRLFQKNPNYSIGPVFEQRHGMEFRGVLKN